MDEIGRLLRETREKLGLTYEEIERTTRIRTRYLQAMEEGDIESLPSPVQARGFLHNYAEFLGLDADDLLLQYTERLRGERGAGPAPQSEESRRPSVTVQRRGPSWLSSDLLVAGAIVVVVLAVLIWGGSRVFAALGADQEAAIEEGVALVSTSAPTATLTQTPAATRSGAGIAANEPTAPPEGTLPPDLIGGEQPTEGVNVRVLVEKRSYLQIFVDGEEVFSGRVAPGDIQEYGGAEQVRLVTGNGGGVRVVYNGQDQGRLGQVGEVVTRLWDSTGAITPTPTATDTPTSTPEQSATPSATPSPTGTALP